MNAQQQSYTLMHHFFGHCLQSIVIHSPARLLEFKWHFQDHLKWQWPPFCFIKNIMKSGKGSAVLGSNHVLAAITHLQLVITWSARYALAAIPCNQPSSFMARTCCLSWSWFLPCSILLIGPNQKECCGLIDITDHVPSQDEQWDWPPLSHNGIQRSVYAIHEKSIKSAHEEGQMDPCSPGCQLLSSDKREKGHVT